MLFLLTCFHHSDCGLTHIVTPMLILILILTRTLRSYSHPYVRYADYPYISAFLLLSHYCYRVAIITSMLLLLILILLLLLALTLILILISLALDMHSYH